MRLDYKREIPNKLGKLVAAFANTRGGLILLGVDADKKTNLPNWPCAGMKYDTGLPERILQICQNGVYPPILPEMSPPIEDPNDSDLAYLVVRIDESESAPHSLQNGKEIYIRTGEINKPIDFMHIDKIAELLSRRRYPKELRVSLVERHHKRCSDHSKQTGNPLFWWSVTPVYCSEPLCAVSECQYGVPGSDIKRAPGGYWSTRQQRGSYGDWIMGAAGKHGDIFYARRFSHKTSDDDPESSQVEVHAMAIANITWTFSFTAKIFITGLMYPLPDYFE